MAVGTRDRAFAVAAVRALGPHAEGYCARRSPDVRRFAAELARDPTRLRAEAAALDRAVPAGIAEVHPSWYAAPPAAARPEAAAWLERRAYGHLVETAVADPQEPLGKLELRATSQVAQLLVALGRRRVAAAFSGAPRGALAQLCARLGEPYAGQLLAEVRALASQVGPDEVMAAQRALADGAMDALEDARALFLRVGIAWLGPALMTRGGDRLRRFAQRLPQGLGRALLHGTSQPSSEAELAAVLAAATAALASLRSRTV
jgi:hypothetical protein